MSEYTEEMIEEMIREAVEKTEKSFGGTFKRLKSENEQLKAELTAANEGITSEKEKFERRISELEGLLSDSSRKAAGLAVKNEIHRQLKDGTPLPDRFIDFDAVEYSDDEESLKKSAAAVIETGRKEFEQVLDEIGVNPAEYFDSTKRAVNPTNPPSRDTATVRDLKRSGAVTALKDMSRRGMLR